MTRTLRPNAMGRIHYKNKVIGDPMIRKTPFVLLLIFAAILLVAACGGDDDDDSPSKGSVGVTVENCSTSTGEDSQGGFPVLSHTYTEAPSKAITMNQHTTELMLALGLEDQMAGTAYLENDILPEFQDAYNSVPVLANEYPSKEVILGSGTDFIYAGFASAFRETAAGSQADLAELGIPSYLTLAICKEEADTIQDIYDDISNISRIFEVQERGEALIESIKEDIRSVTSKLVSSRTPLRVFFYDSGDDAPYTSVCCSMFSNLAELSNAKNIFDDVGGRWATVNWEEVIERDPEVIVLTEAVWSTAQEKMDFLASNEALAGITAVKEQRFVTIDFTSMVPGIRSAQAVRTLAQGIYPESFK